jgi:tetratricopeptide (TPR) repeat protein
VRIARILIASFLLCVAPATKAFAEELRPLRPLSELPCQELVNLVALQCYSEALKLADSLIAADSTMPEGYFFRTTILNNRSIDYEDDVDAPAMKIAADSVLAICERRQTAHDSSALLRFYAGSTDGFRMIRSLRFREYLAAFRLGSRAAEQLEEAVAIDSTCWDAYTGLGNYYYFKSKYSGILRSTGLVSDRRDEGVECLRKAAKYGSLTQLAAASSIAWIWIDRDQPDSAIEIVSRLHDQYPESRAFLWCLGNAQKKKNSWRDAIDTYTHLLSSIRGCERNNHYNEVGCLHSLARAHAELNEWREAVKIADEALSLPLDPDIAKAKSPDIKRLRDLREQGQKKLAEQKTN